MIPILPHPKSPCSPLSSRTAPLPPSLSPSFLQNMIDGCGISGYEGVFRTVAEATLSVLRAHRPALMSVLDTFLHDPLVEWNRPHRGASGAASAAAAAAIAATSGAPGSTGAEACNPHAKVLSSKCKAWEKQCFFASFALLTISTTCVA